MSETRQRTRTVTFRISPENFRQLCAMRAALGVPTSTLIRAAIGCYVRDYRDEPVPGFPCTWPNVRRRVGGAGPRWKREVGT